MFVYAKAWRCLREKTCFLLVPTCLIFSICCNNFCSRIESFIWDSIHYRTSLCGKISMWIYVDYGVGS